jgi:hypothetical protein
MTRPAIFIAHSKNKHGFTVRSYELWPSERYGSQKAGWHVASDDTLADATARVMASIRNDWRAVGDGSPPAIVDKGRVSALTLDTHTF